MMNIVSGTVRFSRRQNIGVWVLRAVVALAFAAAGSVKLAGAPMMVAEFDQLGLGGWFLYVTGLTEITAAVLLVIPATGFVGALLALSVCAGALVAQMGPLHGDVVHVFVLGALVALTAWLLRPAGEMASHAVPLGSK